MESATLDLPGIDESLLATAAAPAAPKTELAAAAAGALDLKKLDLDKLDLSTLAIAKFGPVRKQLADAKTKLTGAVHDLTTQAKVDDAKSLRQRLINAPLADARKVSKALKAKLKSVSEDVGAELESIETGFADAAKLITPQIEAREMELAAEKAEREAKEAARRKEFEDKVAVIHGYLVAAKGLPSPRIQKGIEFLVAMTFGDEWAEFKAIAEQARDTTLASLRELLASVQADEAAAAERERIKAENERLRAENERLAAEQRAEAARLKAEADALAAERAELARQREALAAVQRAAPPPPADPAKEDPPAPAAAAEVRIHPGNVDLSVETDGQTAVLTTFQALQPQTATATTEGVAALMSGAAQGVQVMAQPEAAAEIAKARSDAFHTGTGVATVSADAEGELTVKHVPLSEFLRTDPLALADRTGALPLLLAHIAEAFDTKFPSQPKPSIEWWAKLKRLAAEVQ